MARISIFPRLVIALLFLSILFYYFVTPHVPHSVLSYATRPLWDVDESPTTRLAHFHSTEIDAKTLCDLHEWPLRGETKDVWDATIFATELDLLLIRLHELSPVVSKFFLVESTTTFTGHPKPLILGPALEDDPEFAQFLPKIHYKTFKGRSLEPNENPFTLENEVRQAMSKLLQEHMPPAPEEIPLLLFSDVDELVSNETVGLLSKCEFETPLHLGLKEFVYSFEWAVGGEGLSWRAQVTEWKERGRGLDEFYRHGKVTDRILVDSGWHCSWCFAKIDDFITKATGYSHTDRLGSRPEKLLAPARIQKTICDGDDMFSMLPEAYTWRDMAAKWKLVRTNSGVNLPSFLLQNARRFSYLLPGGCERKTVVVPEPPPELAA